MTNFNIMQVLLATIVKMTNLLVNADLRESYKKTIKEKTKKEE